MSMIMYRTNMGGIEAVEIRSQRHKSVTLMNGMREHRRTDHHSWHDTWEEAHQFIVQQIERKLDKARRDVDEASVALARAKGMKQP